MAASVIASDPKTAKQERSKDQGEYNLSALVVLMHSSAGIKT